MLDNRPDFFFHWLALNALGVSIVPLNGDFSSSELSYVISHSELDLIVSLDEKRKLILNSVKNSKLATPVLFLSNTSSVPPPTKPKKDAVADINTECAMLYTSGSTGQPKGCVLNNEYFIVFGEWYRDLGGLCELSPGKERLLTPLPLVHMNALACSSMAMMITGGCIIQLDRFHPSTWWQTVRESGATALHYLGVLPAILLNIPENKNDKNHSVKFGFGAGVNPKHHALFEKRFGFPLIEAWAMTESGAGGCIAASHEPRHVGNCCFGKLTDKVSIKLIDENGHEVSEGAPGELLVRATGDNPKYGFFSHYFKNEAATAETWKDNWLHTGDVVRQGEDGSLYFVDRRKNVIRRSGENISALEVETALILDDVIDKVAVAPVYDEIRGDEVMACIVLNAGVKANQQQAREIFERSYQQLTYFKTPGYIAFVEQLPLTASQKLKRGEMKELCANLIQEEKAYDLRHFKKRVKNKEAAKRQIVKKPSASFEGVALVAPSTIPYSRFSENGAQWFFGKTLAELTETAGIKKEDVDGIAVSSFTLAPDSVISLTEYFNISPRWIEQIPLGGASGVIAMRRAARAIQMGDASIIACIGADTNKPDGFKEMVANFSSFSAESVYPYGAAGPNGVFSLITQHYMDKYGATREDFGQISLSQRYNAQHYSHALLKQDLTMKEYISARPISGPLHLFDCVMPCAGAEGFLVMSVDHAVSLDLPYVTIEGSGELHNAYFDDPIQYRSGWSNFASQMFEQADIAPKDVDLLYTYDDYPVISMMQMEDLGFCNKGDAPRFVREMNMNFDGGMLVHNSSGGQLSCGQAGSAAGYMGVVEAIRQLNNQALGNQVKKAKTALVSGYGMVNYDRGLCSTAAILKKGAVK